MIRAAAKALQTLSWCQTLGYRKDSLPHPTARLARSRLSKPYKHLMNEGINDRRHGPASKEGTTQHVCVCCTRMSTHLGVHTYVRVRNLGGPADGKLRGRGRGVQGTQLLKATPGPPTPASRAEHRAEGTVARAGTRPGGESPGKMLCIVLATRLQA